MNTPEELAYTESVRALEQQARVLDELRSRTGVLLAAASIVASFLGAAVLDASEFDTLAGLALVAFMAVIGLSLVILWPQSGWRWAIGAKVLLEDWADTSRRDDPLELQRFLAVTLQRNRHCNQKKIDRLFVFFQIAVLSLGLEVVFWTLKLA